MKPACVTNAAPDTPWEPYLNDVRVHNGRGRAPKKMRFEGLREFLTTDQYQKTSFKFGPFLRSLQKQPKAVVHGLEQIPGRDRQEQGRGGRRAQGEADRVGGAGVHRRYGE